MSIFDHIRIQFLSFTIVSSASSFREIVSPTFMSSFQKAIFKLNFRATISIEDISFVNSFFSKIDFIMKTKKSLSIKAKKQSFDVKNKRSRQKFDDQSIRRLRFRFKRIEKKNLQTRRNNKNKNDRNKKSRKKRKKKKHRR